MDHKSWRTVRRAGGLGWARSLKLATMFFILAVSVGSGTLVPRPTEAGDGTCSVGYDTSTNYLSEVTFTCVATSAGGYTPCETDRSLRGIVLSATSDPGALTLTAAWDATVTENGADIFGGAFINQSSSATLVAFPITSNANGDPYTQVLTGGTPVNGKLTLTITNNSQANSNLIVRIRGFFR